ncbi:competence/damage-inducible protein A [candidate division KSB1 bacterium]|nr:competence/damage-inducible protein A [candidate division KSB1 bacterium]
MRVELIAIGDELLIGQTINSNASWIGEQLLLSGLRLRWVTTVGDHAEDLLASMTLAGERADIVLLTGGLGPTHDDITKAVACRFFNSNTTVDEAVLNAVRERFSRRGIPMAPINEEQARVPQKARILANDRGTAPGFVFEKQGKRFYIMPGVPFEMQSMMQRFVLPELRQLLGASRVEIRTLATTGIAESTLFSELNKLDRLERYAKVAFLPSLVGVKIRLTAESDENQSAAEKLALAEKWIFDRVGHFVFANQDINLETVLAEKLIRTGDTLAVAESCTGGLIANRLTDIPGSSRFFERGIVAYSNRSKQELLAIKPVVLQTYGAVSSQTAAAMAENIRHLAKTTFGLSVTGIAGPSGATPEKPVGLVFIACAHAQGVEVQEHRFADDRAGNKMRASQAALILLHTCVRRREA